MTGCGKIVGFGIVATRTVALFFAIFGAGGYSNGVPLTHVMTESGNIVGNVGIAAVTSVGGIAVFGAGGGGYS